MENKNAVWEELATLPLALGACKAGIIKTEQIKTDASFRSICASNACGVYGKCWMCPPDVGEIDALMQEVKSYRYALVYQTVTKLEDSFDYEGMVAAKQQMPKIIGQLRAELDKKIKPTKSLHLGAGGCGVCDVCAKRTNEPCRLPHLATSSLEAYGINVSELAKAADMKYINGQDTVTYFGAVLFDL